MSSTPDTIAKAFHAALVSRDWTAMRTLSHDDATWTLLGMNRSVVRED